MMPVHRVLAAKGYLYLLPLRTSLPPPALTCMFSQGRSTTGRVFILSAKRPSKLSCPSPRCGHMSFERPRYHSLYEHVSFNHDRLTHLRMLRYGWADGDISGTISKLTRLERWVEKCYWPCTRPDPLGDVTIVDLHSSRLYPVPPRLHDNKQCEGSFVRVRPSHCTYTCSSGVDINCTRSKTQTTFAQRVRPTLARRKINMFVSDTEHISRRLFLQRLLMPGDP